MAPKGRFELRIDDELLQRIDEWAAEHDAPPRAEAVRRLIEDGLAAGSKRAVRFSDGEKLLMLMMRDVYNHLKMDGEIAPDFIADVIFGGHYWAPKWDMQGLFNDHIDDPRDVKHVVDVLDMWGFIEEAYEKLTPEDKKQVDSEYGGSVRYEGFDGNNEGSQYSIAGFLIGKMGRFERFKKRLHVNSHMPTYARYRRMLAVFERFRPTLIGHGLNAKQLVQILKAKFDEEAP